MELGIGVYLLYCGILWGGESAIQDLRDAVGSPAPVGVPQVQAGHADESRTPSGSQDESKPGHARHPVRDFEDDWPIRLEFHSKGPYWHSQITLAFMQNLINGALADASAGFRLYEDQRALHPKDRFFMVTRRGGALYEFDLVRFANANRASPLSFHLGFLHLGGGTLVADNDQGQNFIGVKGHSARQIVAECFEAEGVRQIKVHEFDLLFPALKCAGFEEKFADLILAGAFKMHSVKVVGNKRDGVRFLPPDRVPGLRPASGESGSK